jgi:formate hydrogenlyase subunit 3/multisubunit Na+/H+ antiporter MnhD subunit
MGLILICGMPPSILFLTELKLVFTAPVWISITILVLLFIVFTAMMRVALSMTMGKNIAPYEPIPKRLAVIPSILFVILISTGVLVIFLGDFI